MVQVLFLNSVNKICGVYQYGKRVYDIIRLDSVITYVYHEISNHHDYVKVLKMHPECATIIYNYHSVTMHWLNPDTISKNHKNIGIVHESSKEAFDIVYDIDPEGKTYPLPRPLFENIEEIVKSYAVSEEFKKFLDIHDEDTPIFGSFGFGFDFKGYPKMAKLINDQYEKAIIKIVMPKYHNNLHKENLIMDACKANITKPGIQIYFYREFATDEEILIFLHDNTANAFLFDRLEGRGNSSSLDFALSAKKPIILTNSSMFRHVYTDKIDVDLHPINECIENSKEHIVQYLQKYSNSNLILAFRVGIEIST